MIAANPGAELWHEVHHGDEELVLLEVASVTSSRCYAWTPSFWLVGDCATGSVSGTSAVVTRVSPATTLTVSWAPEPWAAQSAKARLLQKHREECQQAFARPPVKVTRRGTRVAPYRNYARHGAR